VAENAKKTEHAGPKKGRGAYWGRKADAKRESNRTRREVAKQAVSQGIEELNKNGPTHAHA
jgi:hypothetical protein